MTPRQLRVATFGMRYGITAAALAAVLSAGCWPAAVNTRPILRTHRNEEDVADDFYHQLRKIDSKERRKKLQRAAFLGEK